MKQDHLYKTDFHAWTSRTAKFLREGRIANVDLKQVAEEIEDMGNKYKLALISHLTNILEHLLKLDLPRSENATWTAENENGWKRSVRNARFEIRRLIKRNPSLDRLLAEELADSYRDARDEVSAEYQADLSPECPYTWEEILPPEFRKPPRKGGQKSLRRHKPRA